MLAIILLRRNESPGAGESHEYIEGFLKAVMTVMPSACRCRAVMQLQ
jgi:hypothetical protein